MNKRQRIYNKFGGLCAYSGTPLEDDWQIDHIEPVVRNPRTGKLDRKERDREDNMVPTQKIINHYKHSLDLETFRGWYMRGLHLRLRGLPKNPISAASIGRKEYLLRVAGYFGITEDKPFDGVFYFERINPNQNLEI